MFKNVSGQFVGAQLVTAADGSAFTGAVTVSVTGDNGTQATGSVGSGACTHEGNGWHSYAPAQAETNYSHVAFTFTGTGAVPVTVQVWPLPYTATSIPAATAGAADGLFISGTNSSLTITGQLVVQNGIDVSCSTSDRSALALTGNGTGRGALLTGGTNGEGLKIAATNAKGLLVSSTSNDGVSVSAGNKGATIEGGADAGLYLTSAQGAGLIVTTAADDSDALQVIGGAVSGDGINITTASGHGIDLSGIAGSGKLGINGTLPTVVLTDASLTTAKLGTFALAKGTNLTGFNDIGAGAAMSLTAGERNTLAAVVLRRTMANVEADAAGDSLDLSSLYGLVQQAQESAITDSTLSVKKTDGTTELGTKTLTSSASAQPITGVS